VIEDAIHVDVVPDEDLRIEIVDRRSPAQLRLAVPAAECVSLRFPGVVGAVWSFGLTGSVVTVTGSLTGEALPPKSNDLRRRRPRIMQSPKREGR
jgi:hypothetical protein